MHGCILWQENAKTEDKKLEKYKNKILGQNICKPQTQNKPCPFQHRNHFHQGWLTLTHSSSVSPVYLYLEFVQLCVPIIQLYRCLLRVAHLSPLLLWLFVYPNKLHCSSYLADRKQGQSWCAAPWHHFLCLWEKCTCREAWGPPAELPGLPVTAWRHTVVEYPAVKFDPDPLESSCLSLPCSQTPARTTTRSLPLTPSVFSSLPFSSFSPLLCPLSLRELETSGFF